MPAQDERSTMPWLTIVRWEYDGSGNEGMPSADENDHMLMLEAALEKIEHPAFCLEGYRRIGAGVREFVYYVSDRERFLQKFNSYTAKDPRYPITIKFYKDEAWSDLQDLIDDFKTVEHGATKSS
ncbi:DUF695 domain-containing protein [Undibacterium sp. TJN25]|uniref:DUF695 domain-containing protein n=1 Tax=Undibacterium sp. TJN25 TaxID=3413056 RepID=UPI003BEFBE87